MRRPDIELSDVAAAFVERHPDLVEKLAARADDTASDTPASDTPEVARLRVDVRSRIRERLAAGRTEQAHADRKVAGQAFGEVRASVTAQDVVLDASALVLATEGQLTSGMAHAMLLAVQAGCDVATCSASTLRKAGFASLNDLGDAFPPD